MYFVVMYLCGKALALARRRHATEEAAATRDENGFAGGSATTITTILSPSSNSNSSSSSSTEHKVDIDTGHLVLYIIVGFLVGVFVPVLLIVFCTEAKELCCCRFKFGLLLGKRGTSRKKEKEEKRRKSKNRQQQIIALHPLNTPLEHAHRDATVPVPRDWVVGGNPAVSGAAQGEEIIQGGR